MEKSPLKQFLASKSLIIGLCVVLIAGLLYFVLSTQETPTPPPTPTPTTSTSEYPIFEEPTVEPDKQVEGQIIVKFGDQYTDDQINERLKEYDAEIIETIQGINLKVVKVPVGRENEIIEALRNEQYVESAEGDFTNHIMYTPNDSLFKYQWGLKNTGATIAGAAGTAGIDVKAEAAWDVTRGNGVKVAVLDTGIDPNHPDFAGKIVAQKAFATAEINDKVGHGTHVAGTVTTATNNSAGIAGTCPDCQLIIGKVMGDNGKGELSNIVAGITWAADQGAKVINLSLGTTLTSSRATYQSALDYAISKGAVVIVSAGNCGGTNFSANGCTSQNQMSYPGGNDGIVTVAATTSTDAKSSFSNFGSHVEVAAPGSNIFSTGPTTPTTNTSYNPSNPYYYSNGTSMAAPMTSGVVALIWASPYGTSNTAVINRLYATTDKITGTGSQWTKGRINAAKAVGANTTSTAPTIAPTYVCGGSGVGNVCPPTPSSPVTSVSPSIGSATNAPSANPSGQQVSPPVSASPSQPGSGNPIGGNPPLPCRSTNQMVYNRSYSTNTGQKGYKAHIKNDTTTQGFIEDFFEFFFRIIEWLIRFIGGGAPCPIQPPGGTPGNPTPNPGGGSPITSLNPSEPQTSPSTDPSVSPSTDPSATPSASVSPSVDPSVSPVASASPSVDPSTPGITIVPPVGGNPPGGGGGGGGNLPPPASGGPGGGGSNPPGNTDPNVPNPGGYDGVCKPEDVEKGYSRCFGDGPNSGKCLPPAGTCNAPTQPYPDGQEKGKYCADSRRQEYTPPAGGPRGVCKVCPKGGSVKDGASVCTCDKAGEVESADETMCVKQIEGCNKHDAAGKCLECGNGRVISSDGMKCEAPPPPPPPPPPPGGGGNPPPAGSCPTGQTRKFLGSRSACCPNGYDLGDRGCFKPTTSCPAGQTRKFLGTRSACCPNGYDLGDRGCFKPTAQLKPNGSVCTNNSQCVSGFCNSAIAAGPGGNGGMCAAR
jgi:thermitase